MRGESYGYSFSVFGEIEKSNHSPWLAQSVEHLTAKRGLQPQTK